MLLAQPDAVLCKLAARGNANAYEVLYGRYHQPVFAFVYHLLARRDGLEDCEDIVQDSFAKAFAGIREKRVDGSFRSWIYTIARNRTFDLIRARKSNIHSLDAETTQMPSAAEHTETDKHAEQRVELSWLVAAVSELPERQREALLMRELGGLSHTQIASQLDTTVSATKKLIGRGRAAVTEAAVVDGYRPRHLGRDLAMAAPVVPLTLVGLGLGSAAGGAAFAASSAAGGGAAVGGAAFGSKAAATVLTVVALGGGAAVVEHNRAADSEASQQSISTASGAAANAVANSQQAADRRNGGGKEGLPLFGPVADDDSRDSEDRRGRNRGSDDRGSDDSGDRGRRESRERELEDEPRPARREEPRYDSEDGDHSGSGGGDDFDSPEPPEPDDDGRHGSGGNSGSGGSGGGSNSGPGSDSVEEND